MERWDEMGREGVEGWGGGTRWVGRVWRGGDVGRGG